MLKAVSALVKNIKTKGWKDDTDFGTGKRAEVGQLLVYQGWSAIYKEYRRLKPAPAAPAAAAKDPRSSAILQATGGDLAGALASIGKAIDAAPKDASLHKLRGAMHVIHRDMTAAIADFSAAIEVNPKDTESYRHRADIYGKTGQTEKAIADQRTIMRLHDEERAESERKLREQEQKMRELQEKLRELEKDAR
jgi:tetratricopeptide (TPR) repeat protein